MSSYPKTDNLYKRDEETKQILEDFRNDEFYSVNRWHVTEKVDGSNHRIFISSDGVSEYKGRTDKANIPPHIHEYFNERFPFEKLHQHFSSVGEDGIPTYNAVLYGEVYGPKVQKGGNYRDDVSFMLFDVRVGHLWLRQADVKNIAEECGIEYPPLLLENATTQEVIDFTIGFNQSKVTDIHKPGHSYEPEGVIARSAPLMLKRNGGRVIFKLKRSDLKKLGKIK